MKRKFITNLGLFLFLNVIIKFVYVFFIDIPVQNSLGVSEYGRFFFLFNTAIIFQIFLDLGIENFIRREIARHPEKVPAFLSNVIFLKAILFLPYAAICFLIARIRGIEAADYLLLFVIMFNQFLASFILYLRANLGGLQLFKTESVVSILDRSLMILIVGSLLLYPATGYKFQIEWFVYAQTSAYGIALLIGLSTVLKQSGKIRIYFNIRDLLPVIRQLLPYASLSLLMSAYYRAENVWLGLLTSDGDAYTGIYAHSFRILDFLSNYAVLFPVLLIPLFSKAIHEKSNPGGLLQLSLLILIIPSSAALAPAIVYRELLFDLFYVDHIQISADSFAILTISFFGMCISYTFGALLTANGNLRQLNIMAGFALMLSTVLNFILIPRFQVLGAAVSNASVLLFTVIIHLWLVHRIFKFRVNSKLLSRLIVYFIILAVSSVFIRRSEMSWIFGTLIISGSALLFALISGLLNIRGFLIILKSER